MGDETKIEPSVLFSNSEECRGLTSQIPETLYFGTAKVSLTCIEVSERFIAFGSDVGALFLFNRALGKFAKPLRTNVDEVINAVRIQSGETDVLAAGHKSGTVAVLRLPSSAPGANRKMQQHCLGDVHKGREVSCFDWSPDGSKLFSADSSGTVIMTMIDFENEVFHSTFVCAESSPIVQISYGLSRLAVSSEERSFVVDLANGCSIIQIGASSRSSQGKYGIVALVEEDTLKVVTSRPNCRLWVANGTTGHVDKTVIFAQQMKTAPLVCAPESLGSALDQAANDQPHCVELGYLKKLSNDLLVASDSRTISLVDLRRAKVLSKTSITSNELTVRSVCVDTSHGQSTVFVLLDKKHLLRLSDQPSPAEFINVPAPGVAASFLSGSFLPTKTSALLSKLKPPIVSRAKMDALPFGSTFGLESLFGSHKESFLKGSASTANAQRSQAESVENAIASMNEKLQIGESDSSSNAADKSSDEGEELLGRAGWRENVADAVNALVDHVGGAMTDVQTGEFVTGDMSSFTSSPNSIYAGSPLEPPKDDRVVVTRQHRMKRKHKNGKSRDSSVVGARSRSVTRSSGASTPMQELVNNENNEKNENIESKENTKNHENNVSESESNFYAQATRAALERMLDEHLVLQPPVEEPVEESAADDEHNAGNQSESDSGSDGKYEEARGEFEPAEEETDEFENAKAEIDEVEAAEVKVTAKKVSDATAKKVSDATAKKVSDATAKKVSNATKPSPDPKFVKSQYEYDAYQVLLADSSRNLETHTDQFNPEPSGGEYVIDDDLIDSSHPFGNSPRSESLDIWSSAKMAFPIVSVAATDQYIMLCDSRKRVFHASLHSHELKWYGMIEPADQVAVSGSGRLVWRIYDKTAFALQRPVREMPGGQKWIEAAKKDIRAIALSSSAAWYLRTGGKVGVQLDLTPTRPCYRVQSADCDWPLNAIAVSDSAVWALRDEGSLMVRAGLKENPVGVDWIQVCPDGPSRLVSISLFEHVGWAIDSRGDVWFIKGVDFHTPFGISGRWFQVASPTQQVIAPKSKSKSKSPPPLPSIASTKNGVCLSAGSTLYVARGPLCGHRWKRSVPKKFAASDNFAQLAVEGLFDATCDAVFLLRGNAEIFVHRLQERNLISLPTLPGGSSNIACIAANLGVLWALDTTGKLYLRTGIDAKMAPTGVEWVAAELSQFENERIVNLACAFEAVWALTNCGSVKMCVGRDQIYAAWVPVDLPDQLSADEKIDKVYAGPDGAMVWARSTSKRVWARSGITDMLPIGEAWVEVCGLSCQDVALGSSVVWSLDTSGRLHRRYGIGMNNPAGNYWKAVPATLSSISVTPHNRLWALDRDGRLVRHQVEIYRPTSNVVTSSDDSDINADVGGDFEVI